MRTIRTQGGRTVASPVGWREIATFSLPDSIAVSESGDWGPAANSNLLVAYAWLKVAGTTETVVVVKKNGGSIATITFAATETTAETILVDDLATTDVLSLEITSAGTGAEFLTVKVMMT